MFDKPANTARIFGSHTATAGSSALMRQYPQSPVSQTWQIQPDRSRELSNSSRCPLSSDEQRDPFATLHTVDIGTPID